MEIQNIVPVDYSNQRVMTSKQVAEVFTHRDEVTGKIIKAVTPQQIQQNFANNRNYFIKDVHYFKIEGDELKKLRFESFELQISPMARVFYLWTEAGVYQHAKMLNTPKAWKIYGDLVRFYFHNRDVVVVPAVQPAAPTVPPPFDMQTIQAAFRDIINAAVQDAVKVAVQDAVNIAVQDAVNLAVQDAVKTTISDAVSTAINDAIKNVKAQPKDTCVYVLLLAKKGKKKVVKIGITDDTANRFSQIRNSTNSFIVDHYTTPKISREDAREIERTAQEHFRPYCTGGEFFNIDFQKGCDVVKALFARQMNGEPLNEVFAKNMVDLIVNENVPRKKTKLEVSLAIAKSTRTYTVYPNLRAEMDAHLLTRNSLAALMNMSPTTLGRKLRGIRKFTDEEKIRLVNFFQKPMDYLFHWVDPAK